MSKSQLKHQMIFSKKQEENGLAESYARAIESFDSRIDQLETKILSAFNGLREADNNVNKRYWLTRLEERVRGLRNTLESRDDAIDRLFQEYKDSKD